MFVERLLLTLLLAALAGGAFVWLNDRHRRRVTTLLVPAGRPQLLYFWGRHCAPCASQSRFVAAVAHVADVAVRRIDVDDEPELAERYKIFTLPTTLLVDRAGRVQHINYGLADDRKLRRQLETLL